MSRVVVLVFLTGCGGGAPERPDAAPPVEGEWVELVAADWTLEAGVERHHCARRTVTADMWINAFQPLAPDGTHHTAAISGAPTGPDEDFPCGAQDSGDVDRVLFGSGVGTDAFEFPPGVAILVPAGSQVFLNLHLFNTLDAPMSGRSGMLVRPLAAADVVEEAIFVPAGTEAPEIPPGTSATAVARCTFAAPATIHDLWPHMHQIGRRMTVDLAGTRIFDQPYDFAEQVHWPSTHAVTTGDVIEATCHWQNAGATTVVGGNSSDQEMCVLGFYVSPANVIASCDGL